MTIELDFAAGDRVQIQGLPTAPHVFGTVVRVHDCDTSCYVVQLDDRATPLLFYAGELTPALELDNSNESRGPEHAPVSRGHLRAVT
jgi:hypothetical protein